MKKGFQRAGSHGLGQMLLIAHVQIETARLDLVTVELLGDPWVDEWR